MSAAASKARLFEEALLAYLEKELAFIEAVEQGRADVAVGLVTPWETFEEELDTLLAADKAE